jgi:hypothetical protein
MCSLLWLQVSMRLGSVPEAVLTAGLLSLGGLIVRSRQQGLPPVMYDRAFKVGAYHYANLPAPVKGARWV